MNLIILTCLVIGLVIIGVSAEESCSPGETKKVECNTCSCTDTGVWACTRKFCINRAKRENCTPGQTKKESCNRCFCTSKGSWSCTRKHCVEKRATQVCVPGSRYKDKCNTCVCNREGTNAACTLKFCVD